MRFDADDVRFKARRSFRTNRTRRAPAIVAAIGVRTPVSDARKTYVKVVHIQASSACDRRRDLGQNAGIRRLQNLRKRKKREIQRAASTHILVAERIFEGTQTLFAASTHILVA